PSTSALSTLSLHDALPILFRHFPISTSHPYAEQAAEAAEAGAAQGRFWEMHDHLFENRKRLRDEDLHRYAGELGLDVERFDQERSEEHTSELQSLAYLVCR